MAAGRGTMTVEQVWPGEISVNTSLSFGWNGAGTELQTVSKTYGARTFVKTITWTNGVPTAVSAWVEQ